MLPAAMWLLPLAAALVAASFTASLARRFPERRSPAIALWAMALAMYAVGCLALAVGVARGFDASTFRLYWIFGAVLNVPFLAAGEVALLWPRPITRTLLLASLLVVTALTVTRTLGAAVDAAALVQTLPSGKDVFGPGTPAHRLPQVVSIPAYLVLLLGCGWSAWRMRGRTELRNRFLGTLAIAGGATVIAGFGSAFAALGLVLPFSLAILVGVAAMYRGFLVASR